jgi:hypothetical protein
VCQDTWTPRSCAPQTVSCAGIPPGHPSFTCQLVPT